MAEKVIIDIELKNIGNAQKALDDLTKKQIEQQEAIKTTQQEIKDYEKSLKELSDAQKSGVDLTEDQIALQKVMAENLEATKVSLSSQKDELKNTNSERRNSVKAIDSYNTALNSELGSNEQLKAQLFILTAEYNKMSEAQREGSQEGKDLTTEINQLTSKLKENEGAVGNNKRNVGNYAQSIRDALGDVNLFGVSFNGLKDSMSNTVETTKGLISSTVVTTGVQKSQAAATASQTFAQKAYNLAMVAGKIAMNLFKLALLATGLGAFLVVAGSLVAFFKSSEEGAQKLRVIMAVLGSVVANVKDVFINFGRAIATALEDPKQAIKDLAQALVDNLVERVKSVGQLIVAVFSGDIKTALKEVADIVTGVSGSFDKAALAARRLANEIKRDAGAAKRIQEDINQLIIDKRTLLIQGAKLEGEFARLREQAADKDKLTQEEIIELLQRSKVVKQQSLQIGLDIARKELQLLERQAQLATNSEEENQAIADKKLDIANKETAMIAETLRITKQIGSESLKLKEENLAAELRLIKASGNDRVSEQILIQEKETAALLEQENIGEKERQAIIAEGNKKIAELNKEALAESLDDQITDLEYLKFVKLQDDKLTNDERIAIEEGFQKDKAQLVFNELKNQATMIRAELEQLSADGGVSLLSPLTEEEETILKKQLNLLNTEMAKASETINGIDGEENSINLLNALGLDAEGQEKLNFAFQTVSASLTAIGNLMNSVTERNKKAIQEQVDAGVISQDEADNKIAKIERKAFKRNKALQIAMAIASTAQAVVSALAQTIDPTPTQSFRTANAIAAGVIGGAQIAAIAATKFAKGGAVKGAGTGTSDSIDAKLSNGEFVQKTKAVDYYGVPFMEAINNMQIPRMFAEGGLVTPTPLSSQSAQIAQGLSQTINSTQRQDLRVINVEQDFSKMQNRVNNVERARTY